MSELTITGLRIDVNGQRATATWNVTGSPVEEHYWIFVDGIFIGRQRHRSFTWSGDGTHHFYLRGADDPDEFVAEDIAPSVPFVRPILQWYRPASAGDDIARWDIYQGDTAGGAVDESEPRMSIPVVDDREWSWTAVMDALQHGETRNFKVVGVRKGGAGDPADIVAFPVAMLCHSPAMIATAAAYDSGAKTLTFTLSEA